VFDRQRLEPWQEQGSRPVNARLREMTISLMDEHTVDPLPDSVLDEIAHILKG